MINIFENSIEKKYSFYELVDEQYELFCISLDIPTSASHVPPTSLYRPDGSDAYDTLYIGCEKFPQHDVLLSMQGM